MDLAPLKAAWELIDQRVEEQNECVWDAAKAKGLMAGYHRRWSDQTYMTVATEQQFELPIVNPETGRQSRTFYQAGKYDGIIKDGSRHFLLEHKTTSDSIESPDSPYFKRLDIDSQVSMYVLAHWQSGIKLDGTVYDVIKKPGIRPIQVPKATKKKLAERNTVGTRHELLNFGSYYGWKIHSEDLSRFADDKGDHTESPIMYTNRVAASCFNKPNWYFQRRMIPRLDGEILEWAQELWDASQAIRETNNKDRHFRNSAACMQYGTPCRYLGVCSGRDTLDSDKWIRTPCVHPELDMGESDGRDALTNSRIKTYQTCRRKHHYSYNLGVVRRDKEESPALTFGTLLHEALRVWFDCYRENPNGNDSYEETGQSAVIANGESHLGERSTGREETTAEIDSTWS